MRVGVLTKAELSQSATRWAQGGVAAVLGGDEDSTDLHLADTLAAGAGLCDTEAVRMLVDEGPARVRRAHRPGCRVRPRGGRRPGPGARRGPFDGPGPARRGRRHRGRGGAGPRLGRASTRAAAVLEQWFAARSAGRRRSVHGGAWPSTPTAVVREVRARHVVLATGGAGQLYAVTTNPVEATGDGIAMALRVGSARRRRRVLPVPSHRTAPSGDAPAASVRGAARARGHCCATPAVSGSSTSWHRATS